jgi:broad specificity phosphatase PhoE
MRLILIRHGESIANVDESAFCRISNHAMDLTDTGIAQVKHAAKRLRPLLGPAPVDVFVGPYRDRCLSRSVRTPSLICELPSRSVEPVTVRGSERRIRDQAVSVGSGHL